LCSYPISAIRILGDSHKTSRPALRLAWRIVNRVMTLCQISGRRLSPRGLRHAIGVGTLQPGVPLNLAQRWLRHTKNDTTADTTKRILRIASGVLVATEATKSAQVDN
jgi:site-specific recombinase XerD